ncbi:MAG: TonB-dependent receptor, partial [Venatoribacter sp.]
QKHLPWLLAFSLPATAAQVELSKQTVSADFRQTDVQALAESTTVVSSEQISARSADHLEQVLSFAPNVNFASGSSRARFFQIRGIGEESQFIDPVNPSIGLVVDGIDMTGLGTGAALFDVQQVEILRGSQGTRFGANALGGLINIQSAAPTAQPSGYVAGKLGTYHSYGFGGALSGALSNSVQGRLAAQRYQSNGYMQNDFLDRKDTQNQEETLLRGKLHWQPNAQSELKLVYFFANMDNGYDAFTVDNSRHTLSDQPGKDTQKTHALSLSYDTQLNSAVNLFSQVTGSNSKTLYSYDEDWVNPVYGELWGAGFDEYARDYQRLSAELRLLSGETGRIFASSTDWVVGTYFMQRNEKLARDYSWNGGLIYKNELDVNALSFYGELTTHFGAGTRLVYGARLENWRNDINENRHYMDATKQDLNASTDEWLVGGKVSLEQDIGLNHLGYLTLARGYKAGGINTAPSISTDKRQFKTEFNNSVETGLKSLWLDDALSTRIAAFYIDRQKQQVKSSYPIPNRCCSDSIVFPY